MKYRIALWASAGLIVAGCWGVYFARANKDNPIEPIVNTLVRLTCPVAIAGRYFPISLYWSLVANAATFALIGLIVETLRRQLRHSN
ncbi:MAG: hypothetical protein ACLQVL_14875 [Terriglobia bacterium]